MITIMEREIIDLNLNCSPWISNASIKEEIRQAIINHEITFKEQLTELHRLCWTQKNLMHDVYTQNSCNKSIELKSNYSHEYQMPLQWNSNSNSETKNNYLSNCTNWVRNDFEIGESSYGNSNQKGKNVRNFIDLGKNPINLESDQEEEEELVCLSEYENGKCWVDSNLDYNLNLKSEICKQSREQTQEFVELDSNDNNTPTNPLLAKTDSTASQKPLLQIDLNIAQNEDPTDYQSLNGSSKGSSITRHADCHTVSPAENPDPQIQPPNSNPKEEKETIITKLEVEDTVSSHMITGEELKTDSNVEFAAETLLSIRSNKSEITGVSSGCISEEDSFVMATLNISEEIKDDATWKSINKFKTENNEGINGNMNNTRSVSLRRGRGLRDFQREVLPGLVSLSRNEICEDLHAIGFEMRKNNRYRRNYGWTGTRGGSRKARRKRR